MSIHIILSALYFFLPAYITNMTPPTLKRFKALDFLGKPVDFGTKFIDHQPILGSHKTWRGVIISMILGIITAFIQKWLYQFDGPKSISIFDYQSINVLALGFLLSAGVVFGDLIFAFIKRRLMLKPGAMFIPFDQINYVIGGWLFLTPFFKIDRMIWVILFVLTPFLHLLTNRTGYLLGIHRNKW